VCYHPQYAIQNLTESDTSTGGAAHARSILEKAIASPDDFLQQAQQYCAVTVELRTTAPAVIWTAIQISDLPSTG
jgi:hypothetical protein